MDVGPFAEDVALAEPAADDAASDVVLAQTERLGHLSLDYSNPVDEKSKLEAGYALERPSAAGMSRLMSPR